MLQDNLLLMTDSYKSSHFLQYPPGTTEMFSYLESRGGRWDETVFFGLRYVLERYLAQPVTDAMVDEAKAILEPHGVPFPEEGWRWLVRERGGRLPLRVRAVPEGSVVPTRNVLMTVQSTEPRCFWVAGWFETLLMRLWYPITVATTSWQVRQSILAALRRSSDDPEGEIAFKLHDFGARGVSSAESAALGGAAHLVSFQGSDTLEGVRLANTVYRHPMAAFSIPAAEHSTITSWTRAGEVDAYRNMLRQFAKPGKIVAVVSDSYDLHHAVDHLWGEVLHDEVVGSGATVVIRPDSGDPTTMVLATLRSLAKRFGVQRNAKGFDVLRHVRVIQGDGVDPTSIAAMLDAVLDAGFSASNLAFGMGGALLQKLDRDTQKFAYKCSHVVVNGEGVDVYKDPITDPGKKSKRGLLDLVRDEGGFRTVQGNAVAGSALVTVFEDGEVKHVDDLETIRARARSFDRA